MQSVTNISERITSQCNLNVLPPHTLHQCRSAQVFCSQFEAQIGYSVQHVADAILAPEAERAIFLAGSVPLGMATNTSDLDFIVIVDSKKALSNNEFSANSNKHLAFSNVNDLLVAAEFVTLINGIALDVHVVVTSTIKQIYNRFNRPRPTLSDNEIKTLSRLSTGWLLWQSDDYLERNAITFSDPALDVYCCTKSFASALVLLESALTARDLADVPLALHLGSASVEMTYLAYFSSEGYSCLGRKWLAQIGHATGAAERVSRQPLLKQGIHLLFPTAESTASDVTAYLQAVSEFLLSIRHLIEQKLYLRDAFSTCPQIPGSASPSMGK
jgi:hypothetical protein